MRTVAVVIERGRKRQVQQSRTHGTGRRLRSTTNDPETTRAGWTQVLFKRMLSGPERPDYYLFVVAAEYTGRLDIGSPCWKADPVQVVSVSENADQQEAMLLMPAYSWVHGELGTFYAEPSTRQFWSASLRLERAGLAE